MRRPAATVVGLFLGTVLLIGVKVGSRTPVDLGAATADAPDVASPPVSGAPSDTASPGPSGSVSPTPSRSKSPRAGRKSRQPKPDATTEQPSGGSGLRSGTFPGNTVTFKYGSLKVTIVVSGGKITDVRHDHEGTSRTSEKINADALPELRRETLQAQSAKIDTVSGATYTSDAYRTSLQAAIDASKG